MEGGRRMNRRSKAGKWDCGRPPNPAASRVNGHLPGKLSYVARCGADGNPPALDVKFAAGGGPILESWSGGPSTVRNVAQGRAPPQRSLPKIGTAGEEWLCGVGLIRQAALNASLVSVSVAATLRS